MRLPEYVLSRKTQCHLHQLLSVLTLPGYLWYTGVLSVLSESDTLCMLPSSIQPSSLCAHAGAHSGVAGVGAPTAAEGCSGRGQRVTINWRLPSLATVATFLRFAGPVAFVLLTKCFMYSASPPSNPPTCPCCRSSHVATNSFFLSTNPRGTCTSHNCAPVRMQAGTATHAHLTQLRLLKAPRSAGVLTSPPRPSAQSAPVHIMLSSRCGYFLLPSATPCRRCVVQHLRRLRPPHCYAVLLKILAFADMGSDSLSCAEIHGPPPPCFELSHPR